MAYENHKALDMLVKKMIQIADQKTAHLPYDKTFHTTVFDKDANGLYTINYLGQSYKVRNALGTDLPVGQSVWVKIPGGIFRNMHICGLYCRKR